MQSALSASAQGSVVETTDVPCLCTLQVWDLPEAVAAGERFEFTVGVKAADSRSLAGWQVALFDGRCEVMLDDINHDNTSHDHTNTHPVQQAPLHALPWPGSEALYWTRLSAHAASLHILPDLGQALSQSAPPATTQIWSVQLLPPLLPANETAYSQGSELDGALVPGITAHCEFTLSLMPLPSHKLRLHVIEEGSERDLSDVLVRVGPWRCETDASGIANLPLGTGLQTLILWKGGYAAPLVNLSIDPDTAMPVQYQVAMRPELEANPDDNWTA